ncbi:hypothetical protein PGT21_002935 [Puccinia graminis f. sp. tritici]|uniref:Uncharacterized protein n=1 Tax=Puccinia graminis f. sp. tritici TaxID=56615 RepID=A0A5B0MWB8_PUCGR|nr:hypothetical protein PGTUg99_015325 [Puccinia graminis f. sp. tritici]KAA1103860.1 hypothetical protein PGT21_002935 [Puccinia graminis f. sp. tritici]
MSLMKQLVSIIQVWFPNRTHAHVAHAPTELASQCTQGRCLKAHSVRPCPGAVSQQYACRRFHIHTTIKSTIVV